MQKVYVPVKASEEMPEMENAPFTKDVIGIDKANNVLFGYYDACTGLFYSANEQRSDDISPFEIQTEGVTWLKPTEAVLLSKEDADRVINAIQGLMYEFKEQNFKIVENGISSEYKSCQQAIDILNKAK